MEESLPNTEHNIDDTPETEDASPSSAEAQGCEPETMLDAVADSVDMEFEADSDLNVENELAESQAEEELPEPQETGTDPRTDTDQVEAGTSEETEDQPEDGDIPDEPDEAELDDYKPKTRRRIEKLLTERNELRQTQAQYQPFVEAMTNSDISQEDMSLLLGAGAALRQGNYEAFLAGVLPYVEQAQAMLGERLTPDLEQQVSEGYVSPEAARELAQRRAFAEHGQHEAERARQRSEAESMEAHATNVQRTISDWETAARQRDPDYSQKQDAVRRYAMALIQERGLPRTAEEAVNYADAAYEEVSKLMRSAESPRRPTRPTPNGALSSNAHGAKGEPNSLMDAALQGLASVSSG